MPWLAILRMASFAPVISSKISSRLPVSSSLPSFAKSSCNFSWVSSRPSPDQVPLKACVADFKAANAFDAFSLSSSSSTASPNASKCSSKPSRISAVSVSGSKASPMASRASPASFRGVSKRSLKASRLDRVLVATSKASKPRNTAIAPVPSTNSSTPSKASINGSAFSSNSSVPQPALQSNFNQSLIDQFSASGL